MVSKARLDLPEPERPVTTMSLSRGISTDMFLRLCTRAPCTAMVVRAAALANLAVIRGSPRVDKRQLLHQDVALLCELDGSRGLPDESLVGQVLARRGHSLQVEGALEIGLDLLARSRFVHFAQVIEHRTDVHAVRV